MSKIKSIILDRHLKNQIKEEFLNKKSISEISRKYSIGRPIITKLLKQEGIYEKRFIVKWTAEMDNILKNNYDEFHNINDLMVLLKVSRDTIKKRVCKLGLTKHKPYKISWLTPKIKLRLEKWQGEISIESLAKELNVSSESLREYLIKIGKNTNLYRIKNCDYMKKFNVTAELDEKLKDPRIPAWQIAKVYGMSETWVHKKRLKIFDGKMINMRNTTKSLSECEAKVLEVLDSLDLISYSNYMIENESVDFYLGLKLIIEVQGKYWHSSLKKQKKDRNKKNILISKGYKILYLEEDEINNNIDNVKCKIKKFWVSHISNNMKKTW